MGTLLEDVQDWWSQHQSERREEAGIPQLKYKEGKEPVWVKERRLRDELPAELSDDYEIKELELNDETRKKIERAKHIFKNDPRIVEEYIDKIIDATTDEELAEASNFLNDKKIVDQYIHPNDVMKWGDWQYFGDQRYDMVYRPDTTEGKKAFRKHYGNPVVQVTKVGSVGLYNALAGTAELAAALTDISGLTDDALEKVEKALPAIDLMEVYGDSRGSIAKMTSVLVQYGLGFGVARQIAKRLITKVAKTKLGTAAAKKAASVSLLGKTPLDIASFGGYWVLPAALGDAVVSSQANITLGDIFGKAKEEGGNIVQQAFTHSKRESLKGLTGKERAAAVLRNKLKFAAEGASIFGGMTLVGPALSLTAKTVGLGLRGVVDPAITLPTKLLSWETKNPVAIFNPFRGFGNPQGNAIQKWLANDYVMLPKKHPLQKLNSSYGVPQVFRKVREGFRFINKKIGIPDYDHWKFSQFGGQSAFWRTVGRGVEAAYSRMQSNFKFGRQSGTALRKIETGVRRIKKLADGFMKDLDRQMYQLADVGFSDIAFQTVTAQRALRHWDTVIKFMRGEVKIEELPKVLRTNSRILRKMIDDQTELLQPILKDSELKNQLIDNMRSYLHTSYRIFKDAKFQPPKAALRDGTEYFMNLMRPGWKKLGKKSLEYKELLAKARGKVNELITIGRSEGSTPAKRLQTIANSMADISVPANIFKDLKNVPDEIAALLGRVESPKQIILDTLAEQAHTLHSFNAYRDLTKYGLGKWIFRNSDEYYKWAAKNNILNPRSVHEIVIRKPYNIDLESVFKNADGSAMVTLPEMAKAISDNTILMDALMKIPFFKTMLMMKASVQMNKTVLSLMTQMRNITTASLFALANGHVGVGASVADNFSMLFKEMVGKAKNPKALRDLLDEALEAGALDSSTIATELEKMIPEMMGTTSLVGALRKGTGEISEALGRKVKVPKMPLDVASEGRTTDQIFEYLFTNKGLIGRVVQKSIEAYQLGDNVWKLFGYQFTKSQLKPALRNLDDVKIYFKEVEGYEWNPLKSGALEAGTHGKNLKTLDDAIKEIAGLQIRDVYPNYSMVPRVVQNIRQLPFFGNFVGFTSEMWRNSWHMLRRGLAEAQSSNAFIRQMGMRRLIGYTTTVGMLGPVALDMALDLTGVPLDVLNAWKRSFAPEFMTAHNIIPITPIDEKGNFKAIDFDAQHPYSDVQMPFAIWQDTLAKGKHTDQSTVGLWAEAFGNSFMNLVKPFIGDAIWWETLTEVLPKQEGQGEFTRWISKNKAGGEITNWTYDQNPWEKVMTYAYNKVLPTTLKSTEKIIRAMQGQVTSYGVKMDPMEEVAATIAGVRVVNIKPRHQFDWKISQYQKANSAARKVYYSDAVRKQDLRGDIALIRDGFAPEYVPELYNKYQQNRYRIWSDTYKDIQNLRIMKISESNIKKDLQGRGAFSKKEIESLMLGLYMPSDMKELDMSKRATFVDTIKDLNTELGTHYTPSEVFDEDFMKKIEAKWDSIPLGLGEVLRNHQFLATDLYRMEKKFEKQEEGFEREDLQLEKDMDEEFKELEDQQKWDEEKIERELNKEVNVPLNTPNVSGEVIKSQPTNLAQSGLTHTEEALLSNEEKAMRLRQKGITT